MKLTAFLATIVAATMAAAAAVPAPAPVPEALLQKRCLAKGGMCTPFPCLPSPSFLFFFLLLMLMFDENSRVHRRRQQLLRRLRLRREQGAGHADLRRRLNVSKDLRGDCCVEIFFEGVVGDPGVMIDDLAFFPLWAVGVGGRAKC